MQPMTVEDEATLV